MITPLVLFLWIANIVLDTLGQIAFKYVATTPSNRNGLLYWLDLTGSYWLWIGVSAYIVEFLLWLAFLTVVPLSQAILLGSINIITVMIVGRILFKEKMICYRLIGFALLLFFETTGQSCFKLTAMTAEPLEANLNWLIRVFTTPWVYISILGYISSFFTWMILLKKAPIGPAFAASHMEIVTTMIVSVWLFDETITLSRLIGTLFIVTGIIFLALAEKKLLQKKHN